MYIILASMPGVGKKSTAMRIGRGLVYNADKEMVKYSNDSQTPQALMMEMQKAYNIVEVPGGKLFGSSALTVLASELVSLLFSGPAMVDFLTDIYDSDHKFEYKTKNMGKTIIKNPCLNIMAGVTTDSLNARVIRDATAGGFMSRSIVIYDNETRSSSAFDMPDGTHEDAKERVIERFRQINQIYGEFSFSKDAILFYREYELVEEAALKMQPTNVEFRSRKPIHVLKVAMLIAASDLRLVITELDVKIAIGLLEKVEHNMKFIHMSSGGHKNAEIHSRIILALGKVQSVDYHDMLTHFMGSTDEETFTRSVDTLVNVKWVKKTRDKTVTPHRTILELTDKGREKFHKYE
jgi:hypothetical protein